MSGQWGFVLAAYAAAAVIIGGVLLASVSDNISQRRRLDRLQKGVRGGSGPAA